MKLVKHLITGGILAGALALTTLSVSAAANYSTVPEATAGVTGRTLESVVAEHQESGKPYGQIAQEAGKLDEFKAEVFEIRKDALEQRVADGRITQAQADAVLTNIQANQAACTGNGQGGNQGTGLGGGYCGGQGAGQGQGTGQGRGMGPGGQGLRDGSCFL